MKSIILLSTAAILGFAAAPAAAQMQSGQMQSGAMQNGTMEHEAMAPAGAHPAGSHMAMSRADRRMMTRCRAMSHRAMMKNRACAKMMRMHPDMMRGG